MNTQAILDFEDFCKIDLESIGKMAPIIYGIVKKIVPFPDNLKSIKELESIYAVCRIEEINNYKNDLVRKAVECELDCELENNILAPYVNKKEILDKWVEEANIHDYYHTYYVKYKSKEYWVIAR